MTFGGTHAWGGALEVADGALEVAILKSGSDGDAAGVSGAGTPGGGGGGSCEPLATSGWWALHRRAHGEGLAEEASQTDAARPVSPAGARVVGAPIGGRGRERLRARDALRARMFSARRLGLSSTR